MIEVMVSQHDRGDGSNQRATVSRLLQENGLCMSKIVLAVRALTDTRKELKNWGHLRWFLAMNSFSVNVIIKIMLTHCPGLCCK